MANDLLVPVEMLHLFCGIQPSRIPSVLEDIIMKNIANPKFNLTDAASEMAMSYRNVQQKLKAITGLTPKQYQRNIKLNQARTILKSGEVQTIKEVMYQVGFENHHYFTKIYKTAFGIRPTEELAGLSN